LIFQVIKTFKYDILEVKFDLTIKRAVQLIEIINKIEHFIS